MRRVLMIHYNFPPLSGIARSHDAGGIERFAHRRLSESLARCLTEVSGG